MENNKFSLFKENFDVRDAVKEVTDIMEFQMEQKGIKLEVFLPADLPVKICSDLKRYKQVLYNLIGNAVKFTFSGSIKVSLKFIENYKLIETSIEDTGIGMQA